MSGIPSDIQNVLGQLLSALSSTDNSLRQQAEATLNKDWTQRERIDVLLVFLAEQAANGTNDNDRAFSAVLFRRFAIKSPSEQGFSVTARQVDRSNFAIFACLASW